MNKLEKLYNLADNLNIKVYYFDLSVTNCLGLTIEESMGYMILLDNSLKNNKLLHTEILAHELGHYFTTVGNYINNVSSYSDKLRLCKCENKANRWAYDFLVPESELIKVLNKIDSLDDLADYFSVTIEFLLKRLEYLSLKKSSLRMDNNRYLILTNLPNLQIQGGNYEKSNQCI